MSESLSHYLAQAAANLRASSEAGLDEPMEKAIAAIVTALKGGKPLLVCGNGGSMADSLHIAGELVSRFLLDRKGFKVIALGTNLSTLTAWANDVDYPSQFAREVEAYGEAGGVLLGITTSGNSRNVVLAVEAAKKIGMTCVVLTGGDECALSGLADILLAPPVRGTPQRQEVHLPLYHYLCMRVEEACA